MEKEELIYVKKKLGLSIKKNIFCLVLKEVLIILEKEEMFLESIKYLNHFKEKYEILILGGSKNYVENIHGIKCYFRKLDLDKKKQLLYHSISSATVSASQAESLPQFLVETILCKNPVAAFNVGGINEIITHKKKMVIYVKILIH